MSLAEFVESLILGKFDCIPEGHVRLNPHVYPGMDHNIGEAKQIGFVGNARFYADPGVPEGQARFIDAEGRITILLPEEKEVEQKPPPRKAKKKALARKRKARTVRTRSSKTDRV